VHHPQYDLNFQTTGACLVLQPVYLDYPVSWLLLEELFLNKYSIKVYLSIIIITLFIYIY
jgi:hypothetical protein